jgi:hypothetical protein
MRGEIAVERRSVAMVYIPNFINTGSGIQKLIGERIQRHTDSKVIA